MENVVSKTELVELSTTCLTRAIEEHSKANQCCILAKAAGDSADSLKLLIDSKVALGKADAFIEINRMLLKLIDSSD